MSKSQLLTTLASIALIMICIQFVDRPLAHFVHEHLHGIAAFPTLTHIADVWQLAAMVITIVAALLALLGWRPDATARSVIVAAIATLAAILLKDQLKIVFGRTWPETWIDGNPSFIRDGVYGFFPFHGGAGWASFPSGHTTVITTPVAALWRRFLSLRSIGCALVALVVIGLLGANYHFAADVVAGLLLGVLMGAGVARLLENR